MTRYPDFDAEDPATVRRIDMPGKSYQLLVCEKYNGNRGESV